jgi:Na+-driven multidrug efflux pump
MFQALGNTMPSLAASISRVVIIAIPSIILSQMSGFELHWIWYLSVLAVVIQLSIILLLLRREFRIKLDAPLASAA